MAKNKGYRLTEKIENCDSCGLINTKTKSIAKTSNTRAQEVDGKCVSTYLVHSHLLLVNGGTEIYST